MLYSSPAVFAVEDTYQIIALVPQEALFWVRVGDICYYDEQNGVLCSHERVHRVCVPMQVLDEEKAYTVCVEPVKERKPYFTQTEAVWEKIFAFSPVPKSGAVRAYHIADAHGLVREPIEAAHTFGNIDFLILNGDLISYCNDESDLYGVFDIMDAVTHGGIPVVYARGNHDLRGAFAYQRSKYTPLHDGKSYYTFRLGPIWGVILDCAEDKPDDHEEYGHTVQCHAFRAAQTAYLQQRIAQKPYDEEGITTRLVIAHNPFTFVDRAPFDIEIDVYREWARLLKEYVHPDLMLCGHRHQTVVCAVGGAYDHLGQPCPMVIGGTYKEQYYAGAGITFTADGYQIVFTDSDHQIFHG